MTKLLELSDILDSSKEDSSESKSLIVRKSDYLRSEDPKIQLEKPKICWRLAGRSASVKGFRDGTASEQRIIVPLTTIKNRSKPRVETITRVPEGFPTVR
ncbi:hypothetical protein HN011_012506 [Eciton burchellii]|nr:hypothetical protein HN011_012506 [Eciton burchellii]